MHTIFFDEPLTSSSLKPFTLTRPVANLRVGILTIAEKWQHDLSASASQATYGYLTAFYLADKFWLAVQSDNLLIDGALCPDQQLIAAVRALSPNSILTQDNKILAARLEENHVHDIAEHWRHHPAATLAAVIQEKAGAVSSTAYAPPTLRIRHTWDIFQQNGQQIAMDYERLTAGRTSAGVQDPHTIVYGAENVFVEAGASIRAAVINAEAGPVYIGKQATVHESAVIVGPFAMLDGSHVNIGSKIRGATTIGPHCKVGGEVKNTVFYANSNKGHEGFIGNAVIGEWCNLGADSNCSNLKNNYKNVDIYHYGQKTYVSTGDLFCGLMMGDHSKCGINTMFNTGTVVGVSCNIFGAGYPPKFIPSFTWEGIQEQPPYRIEKALEVARQVTQRRGIALSQEDKAILEYIYEHRNQE